MMMLPPPLLDHTSLTTNVENFEKSSQIKSIFLIPRRDFKDTKMFLNSWKEIGEVNGIDAIGAHGLAHFNKSVQMSGYLSNPL